MNKLLSYLAILLLVSCQLPLTNQVSAPKGPSAGKASLAVSVATHGFRFAPQSSVNGGRFVVPPTLVPGVAEYVLEDPASVLDDITGDSNTGLGDIPPGVWNLTVTQKNALNQVVAVGTLTEVALNPGANTATVVLIPTRTGTGTLDVPFAWTTASVSDGQFVLDRLTLTGTAPSFSIEVTNVPVVAGVDYTIEIGTKTARFTKVLESGSYQLVLALAHSGVSHPPVTATAEVFNNMVSTLATPMALTSVHLSGPPPTPDTPTLMLNYGYPTFTWTGNPSTASGFRLYRDGVEVSLAEGNDSMGYLQDSTHQSGFAYNYTVRAYNGFGESPDSSVVPFQSVGFVGLSVGGTMRVPAGGTAPLTASVTPDTASFKGVEWTVSNPVVGTYSVPGTQVHALTLGTSTVTATSEEAQGLFGTVDVQVEANVTTLAGSAGTSGSADGAGSLASFNFPQVLTVGSDDVLYTVDMAGKIRSITQDGNVSTLSSETFSAARGIAVDSGGNVFLSVGNAILKVASPGYGSSAVLAGDLVSAGSGDGTGVAALFNTPAGLALSPDHTALYVADSGNHRIRKIILSTGVTTSVVGDGSSGNMDGPITNSQLNTPWGLACDVDGNLYIGCAGSFVIKYADFVGGSLAQLVGTPGTSAAFDGDSTAAGFVQPLSLAIDGTNLYVGDYNGSIRKVALPVQWTTPTLAQVTTIGGSSGSPGSTDGLGLNSRFSTETAVAARAGVVWVADIANHTIRKLQTSAFESIQQNDPQFDTLPITAYAGLATGDGQTGYFQVGSILLYKTTAGNPGKLLVTGIDPDYDGTPGNWRIHVRYQTWAPTPVQGELVLETNPGLGDYLDLDMGVIVPDSNDGDFYLGGFDDGTRRFYTATFGAMLGLYK